MNVEIWLRDENIHSFVAETLPRKGEMVFTTFKKLRVIDVIWELGGTEVTVGIYTVEATEEDDPESGENNS